MFSFEYDSDRGNPGKMVKLTCQEWELREAAEEVFNESLEANGEEEAIAQVSGAFYDEALSNFRLGGDIWLSYLCEELHFLTDELVKERAAQNAIDEYNEG